MRRLLPRYDGALSRFVRRPRTALIAAGACVVVVLAALPLLDSSVIPSFKDRDVLVRLDSEPGTSNPRMTQLTTQLSRELRGIPGVDNVGAHVGRAIGSDQVGDVNSSEVWVSIDSGADYDATYASIQDTVDRVRSARHDVVTYTTQKIKDVGAVQEGENPVTGDGLDVLTGSDKPLAVRVFGQEQDVLRRQAARVQQVVAGVDGVDEPARRTARDASPTWRSRSTWRRRGRRASSPATCAARRPACCRASRWAACSRTRRSSR